MTSASYQRPSVNTTASDFWLQSLLCCVSPQSAQKPHRIDRSMIGVPTNFVHLSHVGANDMHQDHGELELLQLQMCSKGGRSEDGSGDVRRPAVSGDNVISLSPPAAALCSSL